MASILLAGMVGYAYVSAPEIRNLPYRNDNSQIASNSSRILGVSVNSFTVKWQHGQPKTFVVQSPPPFKVGDVVAFKLDIRGETVIIQEYHVWERLSLWYAKLFVSVVPLVVILVLFFKEFSLSWRKLIFLRKT
ncbi:MAG: hypothetical protein GY922_18270 [Proteobacteria bacterium]|nr:hypothetical protein [Pseudomonadota bacterium]